MMDWPELSDYLQSQLSPDFGGLNEFEPVEGDLATRLDEAANVFAETRRWPPLSEEERHLIDVRLVRAIHICDLFRSPQGRKAFPRPDVTNNRLIQWILTDGQKEFTFRFSD
ncbi:MAG: hypothetical protein JWR69_1282 [Pedosphaera sp.]|nr:hypothetical protein [Pedosphaera sp.]